MINHHHDHRLRQVMGLSGLGLTLLFVAFVVATVVM
jgi:hypothetical protein